MKYVLMIIMALSGIQTYQLAFNEKVKKVEVLSGFTEIRQHIESAFDGNEKEKYALIDTIEKAEKSATVAANRNITLSIVTFCVALAGAVLAERNIAKKNTPLPTNRVNVKGSSNLL